jgi:hypothetical protein
LTRLAPLGALVAAVWILAGTAGAEAGEPRAPFDRTLSYDGHDLVLKGASLKEASFLKINVYWVALYLESVNTPPGSIRSSAQVKAFVFYFLRDVAGSKLQKAWIQDLTASCEAGCGPVLAQGRVLAAKLPDIRSSQKVAYVLFPDRVDVLVDGVTLGTLRGKDAPRAVQATFLGPKAPAKLRKELVGYEVSR